ncbi:putative RNA polymerase III C11 subunit [Leptomonas pyrrhocoris]|uniref:DNA-directed RNA polymerase subunit n=1 Tax=Leptomonas pyrrhocoris TaxID=157538 RepID=A0A0N0VG72_LEPPY|nr:putative RNA polymerase III C11 subunit [Leptomonas pyrrhocoris]KPA82661.1 putative RNA polymerase III C11 subunit [Leptomonas pyrrhocoris]|eukprot:XP_015661100.1 putative RNA polymerase III C11 subunit [Leptomonas pyrrhocoris]
MFFCPFCSTLLLVETLPDGNALRCSTCRYVHSVASTQGIVDTNALGEPVLTIHHSFVDQNKKLMDAEDEAGGTAAAAAVGAASASPTVVTVAATADEWVGDGSAEGGQIMTIPCQNEETPCDSTKAYYIQLQMRSADEPATVFFKCVKCGHQWRQD